MKTYNEIQIQIDKEFEKFISELLTIADAPRKYFYWSLDFFEKVGGLSFKYYSLSSEQKERLNFYGGKYFDNPEIQLTVNKGSNRNELTIRNYYLLFSDNNKKGQEAKNEYIKEFIFWQLLETFGNDLFVEIEHLKSQISPDAESKAQEKEDELAVIKKIKAKQKVNFLVTYLQYLIANTNIPNKKPFTDYFKYVITTEGGDLIKKLDDLDKEFIYDPKTESDIKKKTYNLNPDLRKKIANLYILKSEKSKLHFVFSRNSGGGKEELRELLDIMGKKETGNLYRGQANSSWALDASITREEKFKDYELDMFYDVLSLKPDAFQNDKSVYEQLITMQHFGMPTRLLDITRNPLVAIFFACNNKACANVDGSIFTFEEPKNKSDFLNFEDKRLKFFLPVLFNQIDSSINEKEANKFLEGIWFLKGVAKNQRINNQSGDFIFVGTGSDVKKELYNLPKMSIIIDAKTKRILLEQLKSLNIHGGAVYPDLTNLSSYIKDKYVNIAAPVSDLVKEIQKEIPKTSPKEKQQKTEEKETILKDFDFNSIKDKTIGEKRKIFADFYNLDVNGLIRLIDDFLFTEKEPFRPEIARIMHDNPSVIKEKDKIDAMWNKIITLAKLVSGD